MNHETTTADTTSELVELTRARLAPAEAEIVAPFLEGLYAGVAATELLSSERREHLYAAAVSLSRFMHHRAESEVKVRVFNPTIDEHGYSTPHTVVEVVQADMPFLVDSVSAELIRLGVELQAILHPIFRVTRTPEGLVSHVEVARSLEGNEAPESRLESVIHLRVRAQSKTVFAKIAERLHAVLTDVHAIVQDFHAMKARCEELANTLSFASATSQDAEGYAESSAFLRWMADKDFVFQGYRRYEGLSYQSGPTSKLDGLGLLRDAEREVFEWSEVPKGLRGTWVFKGSANSTVHRTAFLDVVVTRLPDVDAFEVFVGLFSLSAYSRSPSEIPLLRRKMTRVLERSEYLPSSYDAKTLKYILETYPRDELFQIDEETLLRIGQGMLRLQHRQQVALFSRRDTLGQFVSCIVFIPRERMDTRVRIKIQDILCTAYGGTLESYSTQLTNEPLARLHFIVNVPHSTVEEPDPAVIQRKIERVTEVWEDRLFTALINEFGEQVGGERARTFLHAFPAAYREANDELAAVADVALAVEAIRTGEPTMKLFRPVEFASHQVRLKVFIPSGIAALSDIVPMLENMGLRVVSEVPYELRVKGEAERVRLQDFTLCAEGDTPIDIASVSGPFVDVFGAVWRGAMVDDGLNKLVVHAQLQGRDVKLLRAYSRYLRQIRAPFSLHYMEATLRRYPEFTRLLVRLFQAKFDPTWREAASAEPTVPAAPLLSLTEENSDLSKRQAAANEIGAQARALLDGVDNLDEDRILRAFLSVFEATVRTNFYQLGVDGSQKEYVALKFDCHRIETLPKPRPLREIFVFSPRVEGVHLRFGLVARGGLRWSDRLEDYRTEVLGLVKAQQVKNAVIVPVGSKGGFVVLKPPAPDAGRDAFLQEGISCYRTFISALLDVTDNRVGGKIVRPSQVIAHDGDDPYLVVAADKGTATFSDIANEISVSRGFWLNDAFASGGSAGYDHKAMGITARGAWESVKRHFRELGKDVQLTPFTCAGVGDMSGDVFGNGMLQSKQIRLVAAFNHQHIFIDPNPDPETSWNERKRLFELPRSAWTDYDESLLSPGGGIFERKAKRITLSPEARALLGIHGESAQPNEVISAILRLKVELLFFGGIGTYVKARSESHAEVGDRANDPVRVDAIQLGAQVIGEGANLAMTQQGRIEYALAGGRCNTDFIDNSAGVDCSDHEVNIKILLSDVEQGGELTRKQRNVLLSDMTEEVAGLVLRDNYLQTQTISVTQGVGLRLSDRFGRFMRLLEKRGVLDRKIEYLPDEEALADRVRRGQGFSRPELATLLSYSKNVLYEELLNSDVPDESAAEPMLVEYFPEKIRQRYSDAILRHQLRREITATALTNELINRMGITFVYEACETTGVSSAAVASAYLVAREVLGMTKLWREIEALDGLVHGSIQAEMLADCGRCMNNFVTWLLRTHGYPRDVSGLVTTYEGPLQELLPELYQLASLSEREDVEHRVKERTAQGVPDALALNVSLLPLVAPLGDVVQLGFETYHSVGETARVYFRVGEKFGLTWLRSLARRLPTERAWDRQAVAAVLNDLHATQRSLVEVMLRSSAASVPPQLIIDAWCSKRQSLVDRNAQLVAELQATVSPNFAMLAVANGHLKSLLADAQKSVTLAPPSQRR